MRKTENSSAGFTLIELLVVIAIIAMLSSVVLSSLSGARGKGNDAAVKANLNNTRAQMQLLYENYGGSYKIGANDACIDTTITKMLTAAGVAGGVASALCFDNATNWAVSGPLKGAGGYWCVDSTGFAGPKINVLTTQTCPAT